MRASEDEGRPVIGISLGDPAGIGPEIVLRALAARPELRVKVYGDPSVLAATASRLRLPPLPPERLRAVPSRAPQEIAPGRPNLVTAQAQLEALETATDDALAGELAALCTAPISKDWIARAGFAFPGHTEYLAHRARTDDFAMMLAGPHLRVVLATTHIALADVARRLTAGDIARAAVLAARTLVSDFGIGRARIAVAGLNPHAGEAGRFGDEERRLVAPGIQAARMKLGRERLPADVAGPFPPDAVFRQAADGKFDAVVALYHDQGLIPMKLLDFDEGVNVTLGLPFIRTSPDHGTAYDIAGSGRANPGSFLSALDLANRLSRRTQELPRLPGTRIRVQ
ncbi:MAG TPA: 4-hydroxythreonine-4-phosphate dehydrogenase PdxA [Polyangia bacterium]|jgi:4-hydroxythreonine-4-phosphate dehydrogenase